MNIKELKEKIAHLPDDMEVYGTGGITEQGGSIYDHSPTASVYDFEDEFSGYEAPVLLICCNHDNDEDSCCGTMERLSDDELAKLHYETAKNEYVDAFSLKFETANDLDTDTHLSQENFDKVVEDAVSNVNNLGMIRSRSFGKALQDIKEKTGEKPTKEQLVQLQDKFQSLLGFPPSKCDD